MKALGTCTFPGCSTIRSECHAELQDDEDREKGAMLVDDMHRLSLTDVAQQRVADFGTGRHPLEKAIRRYLLSYPLEYNPSKSSQDTRQGGLQGVSGRDEQGSVGSKDKEYYKGVGALTSAYGHRYRQSPEETPPPLAHTHTHSSSPYSLSSPFPHPLVHLYTLTLAHQAYTSALSITPGVVSTIGARHPPVLVTPRLLTGDNDG